MESYKITTRVEDCPLPTETNPALTSEWTSGCTRTGTACHLPPQVSSSAAAGAYFPVFINDTYITEREPNVTVVQECVQGLCMDVNATTVSKQTVELLALCNCHF